VKRLLGVLFSLFFLPFCLRAKANSFGCPFWSFRVLVLDLSWTTFPFCAAPSRALVFSNQHKKSALFFLYLFLFSTSVLIRLLALPPPPLSPLPTASFVPALVSRRRFSPSLSWSAVNPRSLSRHPVPSFVLIWPTSTCCLLFVSHTTDSIRYRNLNPSFPLTRSLLQPPKIMLLSSLPFLYSSDVIDQKNRKLFFLFTSRHLCGSFVLLFFLLLVFGECKRVYLQDHGTVHGV